MEIVTTATAATAATVARATKLPAYRCLQKTDCLLAAFWF